MIDSSDETEKECSEMADKRRRHTKAPYSPLFTALFRRVVKIRNQFVNWKESFGVFRMRIRTKKNSEQESYKKLEGLIPNLESYNKRSLLRQLRFQSYRKGYRTLDDFYNALVSGKESLDTIKENVTYIGTHFFRGDVWPDLQKQCKEAFSDTKKEHINVWCAGCSSGKEVYSVLMLLLEVLPAKNISLLATDYNQEMIKRCKEGSYPLNTLTEIPGKYRYYTEKYIPEERKGLDLAHRYQFRFREDIRNKVSAQYLNLITDEFPTGFDLILCRNVMKFFKEDVRKEVQRKLSDSLNVGGFLVVSDELEKEGIQEPKALGLRRVSNTCIYYKYQSNK